MALAVALIGLFCSMAWAAQDQTCDFELRNPRQTKQFAEGNRIFALDIYKAISEKNDGDNIFLSPFSIAAAFGMLNVGSRGETEAEIRQAFKFNANADDVNAAFADVMRTLNPGTDCQLNFTLSTANRLYVEKSFDILDNYQNVLERDYGTNVSTEDFTSDGEGARGRINGWVSSATGNKIKNLFPAGVINAATVLVLVNAIYFKGTWQEQFLPKSTQVLKFQQDLQNSVDADFMSKSNKRMPFANDLALDCKILQMPYSGGRLSMFAILPNKVDGLPQLESRLTADSLKSLIKSVTLTEVDVRFPKFKLTIGQSLTGLMNRLGVRRVFDANAADLSGISGQGGLSVSEAIHKAFVDVNEEGTEATAATGIVVTRLSANISPVEQFFADHPFIFLIYDEKTELILFMGRLARPPPKGSLS